MSTGLASLKVAPADTTAVVRATGPRPGSAGSERPVGAAPAQAGPRIGSAALVRSRRQVAEARAGTHGPAGQGRGGTAVHGDHDVLRTAGPRRCRTRIDVYGRRRGHDGSAVSGRRWVCRRELQDNGRRSDTLDIDAPAVTANGGVHGPASNAGEAQWSGIRNISRRADRVGRGAVTPTTHGMRHACGLWRSREPTCSTRPRLEIGSSRQGRAEGRSNEADRRRHARRTQLLGDAASGGRKADTGTRGRLSQRGDERSARRGMRSAAMEHAPPPRADRGVP